VSIFSIFVNIIKRNIGETIINVGGNERQRERDGVGETGLKTEYAFLIFTIFARNSIY